MVLLPEQFQWSVEELHEDPTVGPCTLNDLDQESKMKSRFKMARRRSSGWDIPPPRSGGTISAPLPSGVSKRRDNSPRSRPYGRPLLYIKTTATDSWSLCFAFINFRLSLKLFLRPNLQCSIQILTLKLSGVGVFCLSLFKKDQKIIKRRHEKDENAIRM